jgi:hypothetical protein
LNKYDLPDRALGDLSGQANVQKSTNHENMEFRLYPMLFFCESVGESTRKHPPDQSRLAGCLEMSNKHKYINTANVVSVGSPASAWANQIDGIDEAGASLPIPPPPPTTKNTWCMLLLIPWTSMKILTQWRSHLMGVLIFGTLIKCERPCIVNKKMIKVSGGPLGPPPGTPGPHRAPGAPTAPGALNPKPEILNPKP